MMKIRIIRPPKSELQIIEEKMHENVRRRDIVNYRHIFQLYITPIISFRFMRNSSR